MSMTEGVDQAVGILRQHDTLGVLPIPDFCFDHNMLTSKKTYYPICDK
jgi:hypothetical protein